MIDRRHRVLVVSGELPSAWHLQAALLRGGLFPRAALVGDLDEIAGESADLVVFDASVSSTDALQALALVQAPPGMEAPATLYLVPPGRPRSTGTTERYLPVNAGDEALRGAVGELLETIPAPPPQVEPQLEPMEIGEPRETPVLVAPGRPFRRRRSALLPVAAVAGLAALVLAYAALASSEPRATSPAGTSAVVVVPTATAAVARTAPAPSVAPPVLTAEPPSTTNGRGTSAGAVLPSATPRPAAPTTGPILPTAVAQATSSPLAATPSVQAASPLARGAASSAPAATQAPSTPTAKLPTATPVPPTSTPVASSLEGRVTDVQTGAGIPGARVEYRGPTTGEVATAGDGRYRMPLLTPGAYTVVVTAPGYVPGSNQVGVVAGVTSSDNVLLQANPTGPVAPALAAVNRATGQPVAVYGYRVRPGDTLRAIAERFEVSEDALLAVNDLSDPEHLRAGDLINVPTSTFGEK